MAASNIVIVESPAKAKTINKYLGSGYQVLASYGRKSGTHSWNAAAVQAPLRAATPVSIPMSLFVCGDY